MREGIEASGIGVIIANTVMKTGGTKLVLQENPQDKSVQLTNMVPVFK